MWQRLTMLLLAAALTSWLGAQGSADAADGPSGNAYKPSSGPFEVRTIEKLVLEDARREKQLQLRINVPSGKGPFPVIVFSHGAYGSKDNYLVLTEHWASHGYVTIQPTHSDSRTLGARPGDPRAFRDWRSRAADVSFVLDSLGAIQKRAPALVGEVDRGRIGVGGHSFGAHTSMLTGGATALVRGRVESFADKRVQAVVVLSGQGPGEMLTASSWEDFVRPMLVMTGSEDGPTRTGQPAEWRKLPYELSPPGDKYLVWVDGLDHGFGGITGADWGRHAPNGDHVGYTQMATLAFWDAYLKKSKRAQSYLRSNRLEKLSAKTLELRHK